MNIILITAIILIGTGTYGIISKREMVRFFGSILTFVLGVVLLSSVFNFTSEIVLFSLIVVVSLLIWVSVGVAILYRRQRAANTIHFHENNRLKN